MVELYSEKLMNIIANESLEDKLVGMFRKYGVSGYTILRARGEGASGNSSDLGGFDSNIFIKVIIPESKLDTILQSVECKLRKGYRLTVYISDVQVISPEKFEKSIR